MCCGVITKCFIILNIVIFLLIKSKEKDTDRNELAVQYGALYPLRMIYKKEYWRFFTANVVHLDFMHIFMNLYAIYYLGGFFEELLGSMDYLFLICISGLMASLVTYVVALKKPQYQNVITLGASGIFYGYLGAMIALAVILKGPFVYLLDEYRFVILINIAFTFLNKKISKTSHLGGMLGGFIAILLILVFNL